MKRLVTLTLQYYRTLVVYNITFTLLCFLLVGSSTGNSIISLHFSKLIGFAGAVSLHYYSSAKTYFYYRNAGLYIRRLYGYTYLIDLAVFTVITLILSICRHLF
ncbi:MAG: hypothetical protein BGO48_17825 [Mucilaginibacter sp. 44-25]|nr:MAG: hypothetical protein BGO48_17825 [Mucilaginibacter sp. 44-25]